MKIYMDIDAITINSKYKITVEKKIIKNASHGLRIFKSKNLEKILILIIWANRDSDLKYGQCTVF